MRKQQQRKVQKKYLVKFIVNLSYFWELCRGKDDILKKKLFIQNEQ